MLERHYSEMPEGKISAIYMDLPKLSPLLIEGEEELSITFDDFLAQGKKIDDVSSLVEKIFQYSLHQMASTEVITRYANTQPILSKFYRDYSEHPSIPLSKRLSVTGRLGSLISRWLEKDFFNSAASEETRIESILKVIRKLIREDNKTEITHLIQNINLMLKKNLYRVCLGKIAPDKGLYSWRYTEWHLLYQAQFHLRPDKKVGVSLQSNPGYQAYYAEGKMNHGLLEIEMTSLAALMGLELDPHTSFHEELIFTEAASKKLIEAGLLINTSYAKALVQIKNTRRILEGKSFFFLLPEEIFDMIMMHLHPMVTNCGRATARNMGFFECKKQENYYKQKGEESEREENDGLKKLRREC